MKPTSYFYDERDGRFCLCLSGLSTLDGLGLFPPNDLVSGIELYTDADVDRYRSVHTGTVSAIAKHLLSLPNHIGIVDFSCVVDRFASFSTHDDLECHFDAFDLDTIHELVDLVSPVSLRTRLWAILQTNPGCYIVVASDETFQTFPDLEALLASQDGG